MYNGHTPHIQKPHTFKSIYSLFFSGKKYRFLFFSKYYTIECTYIYIYSKTSRLSRTRLQIIMTTMYLYFDIFSRVRVAYQNMYPYLIFLNNYYQLRKQPHYIHIYKSYFNLDPYHAFIYNCTYTY